jgi:hypothetical protein
MTARLHQGDCRRHQARQGRPLGDGNITTSSFDTFVEHRACTITVEKQTPVTARPPGEADFTIAQVNRR